MKRMPAYVAVAGTLLLLVHLAGCTERQPDFVTKFRDLVTRAGAGQQASVAVSSATDFTWDKLFVFAPYTPASDIDQQLGYVWHSEAKKRVAMNEGYSLLVFVKNGSVVRHFEYPRRFGDFLISPSSNLFFPGKDLFHVTTRNGAGGWPLLEPTD